MPLTKQTFRLNMGQGLEQKTDAKTLSSGKMVVLQNAQFTVGNRLNKRNGFAAVGVPDATGESIQRLDTANGTVVGWGEPGSNAARSLYIYNQSITTPTFTPAFNSFNDCLATSQEILGGYQWSACDSASVNGFTLYAGLGSVSGTKFPGVLIVSESTGATVLYNRPGGLYPAASAIRCVAAGNFLIMAAAIDQASGAGKIAVTSFNTAAAFATTTVNYASFSITGSTAFDLATYRTSVTTGVFLAYQSSATVVAVAAMNPNGTLSSNTTYTSSATIGLALSVVNPCPSTTSSTYRLLFVDKATTPLLHYVPFNTSLAIGTSATISCTASLVSFTAQSIIAQEMSNQASVAIAVSGINASASYGSMILPFVYTLTTNLAVATAPNAGGNPLSNYTAYSKPIYKNDGNVGFWSLYPSTIQAQLQLITIGLSADLQTWNYNPTARILAGAVIGDNVSLTNVYGGVVHPVNVSTLSTSVYTNSVMLVNAVASINGSLTETTQIGRVKSDFTPTNNNHVVTLNNQAISAGGFPALIDRSGVAELNFFTYPEHLSAVPSFTASGTMTAGVYQYAATFEWSDSFGNLHRSETSVPVSATLSGTQNNVTLTLQGALNAPPLTARNYTTQAVSTVWYRGTNAANPVIFYRVAASTASGGGTFDVTPDSGITSNPPLYTQGGILDNYTIDGTSVICAGPDRLFAANPNNNGLIMVGQPYTQTNGLSFFAGIQLLLPTADGPITNMQYLDTSLIIFKARSIYAVQGVGPTPNGQNNGFTQPQLITSDVGCDNPHAATIYPDGILFKSAKGYYRLGRDLSFAPDTNYIGKAVESFNSLSCLRAVTRSDLNQCRFLLSDNQTILVYDYFFQQWSTIQTSANDMTVVGGSFYLANNTPANGALVGLETVGTFADAMLSSTAYSLVATTGWCALNQLQGAQRIYRVRFLGDFKSAHNLQVALAYDFEGGDAPFFNEGHVIASTNITTSSVPAYQCEVFPLRQKCEAIAIRISDGQPTGESFDLTDIEIEVGLIPGRRFPLAATKGF